MLARIREARAADTLFTLIITMPFKQKVRKKNDGSSSSVPIKKDLASKYKAPFPIYTTEEGERFKRLTKCSFTETAIKFRVEGEELTLDYDKMHRWLGFLENGFASKPKGWNAASGGSHQRPNKGFVFVGNCFARQEVDVTGIMFDTLYNASRHQGRITLGISSKAPILTYAARMPIPAYHEQPTDTFRYVDGVFLEKA
ncbi:hypothetical protein JCGZ_22500 [Jatropha curcas]|uniref:Uncharacterized protein n=1 Tax=Jatropha curcas TaxID=180498 RepID=A0A067JU13_JATCU|nr:hypothetical protein JCGZ_22500 [Jatropha curcas]